MRRQSFVHRMVLILLLVLILLPHSVCQAYSISCTICSDPFPILQEFHQPADLVIGGLAHHVYFFLDTPSFKERPTQMVVEQPM